MENIETKTGLIVEIPKLWLIPLLCLLVIFGVIALESNATRLSSNGQKGWQPPQAKKEFLVPAQFHFKPQNLELKIGEKTQADLILDFTSQTYLDGLDIILAFDPEVVKIVSVVPKEIFSFSTLRQNELETGRISLTFLEEGGNGVLLSETNTILEITLEGKKPGVTEFSVVSSEKGASTVITERETSKKLLFNNLNLPILVK